MAGGAGEEEARARIERGDPFHVLRASSKSKTAKFSAILSLRTDLGIVTTPRCRSQRSTTWATDLPVVIRDPKSTGEWNRPFLPSANWPQASCCTPRLLHDLGGCGLLAERVCLHLVHGRGHLVVEGPGRPAGRAGSCSRRDRLVLPFARAFLDDAPDVDVSDRKLGYYDWRALDDYYGRKAA